MIGSIGMYDGVHLGHQALVADLCAASHQRGCSSAIFTFDSHPLQVIAPEKAPKLLTTAEQKLALLRKAGVDKVIVMPFDEKLRGLSARDFMIKLRDEYGLKGLVMGFNHHFGHDRVKDFNHYLALGQELGIEIIKSPELVLGSEIGPVSSSAIRKALAEGEITRANAMLGRPYAIVGHVSHGYQIGHKLGFPTANVRPDMEEQLIPQNGVYAGKLNDMPAMINIGSRPTVAAPHHRTIEAHVLDYEGDLYQAPVTLAFEHRLRDEQRFPSLDALRWQLHQDLTLTRQLIDA